MSHINMSLRGKLIQVRIVYVCDIYTLFQLRDSKQCNKDRDDNKQETQIL